MLVYKIKDFNKGLVTAVEDFSIAENASSNSLNWLTLGDKIELTGGYTIVGTEQTGSGKVTGLRCCKKADGTILPIRTRGKKIEYYTTDWNEIGTDQLGTDADGEDVSITEYVSLAGYQAWLASPNSSIYKLLLANPASIKDMYDATKNFKGYVDAQNNRLHLWNRDNAKTYLHGSYKDLQNTTVYTSVTAETIGALGSTHYTGTLATITGTRTGFNIVMTDGTQTIQDDKNGDFYGDGTGTINYATGAYDVTFDVITTGAVTANYQYEDSKVQGLADFTFSSPRTASQGYFVTQPNGGNLLNVLPYNFDFYCIHEDNIWVFTIESDDTTVSNNVYRNNIGSTNWRSSYATGDGIYFIDATTPTEPRFKLLTLQERNNEIIPITFSFDVDLQDFLFDVAVSYEWGDYLIFACRTSDSTVNNRLILFNKVQKCFDIVEYFVSVLDDYDGLLWGGDSATNNVMQLFTSFSANGAVIRNYWEGKLSDLSVEELKKIKRLTLKGQIGRDQSITVSLSYDDSDFTEVGTIVGSGDYVSTESTGSIASPQVGEMEIGGGSSGIEAFDYIKEIKINSQKFDKVKIRFEATEVGYASVSEINYYDIKTYGSKNLLRFRTT